MTKKSSLSKTVLAGIFTALIAICSQIVIPLPMIPINLALFAVLLSATLLPFKYSMLCTITYLLLGAVGAPVFASFGGGLGTLFGKTGGYIIGYVFTAMVVSSLINVTKVNFKKVSLASFIKLSLIMVLGVLVCYAFGTLYFMYITKLSLLQSLIYCVFPFIIGDVIKVLLASTLGLILKEKI